jgi:hypothetical protein
MCAGAHRGARSTGTRAVARAVHSAGPMSTVATILSREGLLDACLLARARDDARASGATVLEQLVLSGMLDEEHTCELLSRRLQLPRARTPDLMSASPDVIARLPADVAYERRAVPLRCDGDDYVWVAMEDPTDEIGVAEVGFFCGANMLRFVAAPSELARALRRYYNARTPLAARMQSALPANDQHRATSMPSRYQQTIEAMRAATSVADVASLLVQYLADETGCAAYLAVDGADLAAERVRIPLTTDTLLCHLATRRASYLGPLTDAVSDAFVAAALHRSVEAVAVVPFMARQRLLGLACAPASARLDPDRLQQLAAEVSSTVRRTMRRPIPTELSLR